MDVNIIQALLVFVVAFIMGIDQFSFLESLYQPIVLCPIIGAILGNFQLGVVVGGAYQLIQIGSMPIGGAQPPNAIMGTDRKSTRLNSSHSGESRMPSSA